MAQSKNQIVLLLEDYSIEAAQKALINRLLDDHPGHTRQQLAAELGITNRTLFNLFSKLKIDAPGKQISSNKRPEILKAITLLKEAGYLVKKL